MLTQKQLKKILKYKKKKGVFIWKKSIGGVSKKNKIAGCISPAGYIYITIKGTCYKAHRLAWLYVKGYFPEYCIDHKDRNPNNNKWKNLREVSHSCNSRNTGNPKDNTSGVKGIYKTKRGFWDVRILINKKRCFLGQSKDFLEAVCLRLAGEQALNWEGCDLSSPAYQYVQKNLFKVKPIKGLRGCHDCAYFIQYYCSFAGPKKQIPAKIQNKKGCHLKKKAKIYF